MHSYLNSLSGSSSGYDKECKTNLKTQITYLSTATKEKVEMGFTTQGTKQCKRAYPL